MSDSSDRQKAVHENGHRHKTEATIAALAEKLDEGLGRNDEVHDEIKGIVSDFKLSSELALGDLRGKIDKHRVVAVVLWTVFAFFANHFIDRSEEVFDKIVDKIEEIDRRQLAHQESGMELGRRLKEQDVDIKHTHRHDIDKVDDDLDKLRNEVGKLRRQQRQEEE